MNDPNLGINRVCFECSSVFWCDDGDVFCSTKCSDAYDSRDELDEDGAVLD